MELSEPYSKPVLWNPISVATLALSISGTAFIIFVSLKTGLYRKGLGRLALINIISDFFYCFFKLATIIEYRKVTPLCIILQGFTGVGRLSSLISTTFFGHALFIMVRNNDMNVIQKYLKFYTVFAFSFPASLELLKIFNGLFKADENGNCTVYIESNKFFWRAIAVGLPTLVLCVLSLTFYAMACFQMYQQGIRLKQVLSLLLFPSIVIIGWFPSRIIDILLTVNIYSSKNVANIFSQTAHLVGFFQSLTYATSRSTLREIKLMFRQCKCLRKKGDKEEHLMTDEITEEEEESLQKSLAIRKFHQIGSEASIKSSTASDKVYL